MKTKLIIILALITLNINFVSAHIHPLKGVDGPAKSGTTLQENSLAPVAPAEAIIEDAADLTDIHSLSALAPYTPNEASFDEITTSVASPVLQNMKSIERGKSVHHDFPLPCSVKYGCSL